MQKPTVPKDATSESESDPVVSDLESEDPFQDSDEEEACIVTPKKKLCPGVYMYEIAGGRREGQAIVYEAGQGPDSWTAPTPASLEVSWFHLARALARSRAHAH
jgi:hypothetical protein